MPNIRLLICKNCETTEVVPWYEGDPSYDSALEYCMSKHEFPSGDRHFGQLYTVDEDQYNREESRTEILKQIWQRHGHTGMDPWVYQVTDQLKHDAFECWRTRLRPETCSDFHSDKKILVPPTARERKEEGMKKWDTSNPAAQRYLCDYCPIRSVAEQQVRTKRGLYR
jgi:hypothetical protein